MCIAYYPVTPFQGVEVLEVTADKVKFLWNDYGQKIGRIRTATIREKDGEKVFRTYNLTIPLSGCRKIEGSWQQWQNVNLPEHYSLTLTE